MDKDLELLHKKIDFLTEQVMQTQRRQREMEELRQDLTPVINDVFKTAVEELDQVAPYFSYEDLIFLIKKLLRNVRNLTAMFDQMESARDFLRDATPLSKEVFQTTLEKLDEMERKGYFAFFAAALDIVDKVVTSFTEEDVRQLGDNIVLIINTIKQLTQPEMLTTVHNALNVYRNINVTPPEKMSLFGLMKEVNSPEVRKALSTGLAMLKNISQNLEAQKKADDRAAEEAEMVKP